LAKRKKASAKQAKEDLPGQIRVIPR
jgi:hypothetical protein